MNKTVLNFLIFLTTAIFAFAQDAPDHTCRIVFLDRPSDAPKTLHLFDGVSSQEVELPGMNLSPVYKLRSGPLKLHLLSTPLEDPKALPEGAPSANVPQGCTDFYLLVASDRENKVVPVRMVVVDADDSRIGLGQMLWFNLTDKAIAGMVGGEKVELKPGARAEVKAPRSGAGDYPVDLYFLIKGDDFVHPLCETQWRHDPRSSSLVFVMPEKNRRVPRIFSFSDFRQPEEKDRP